MGKILFIAANALPVNGPEAIVNAKLLKILADAGYQIDVISKDGRNKYFSSTMDSFFSEKLSSVTVINTDNRFNIKTVIGHLKVLLKTGYVYKGAHWAYYAIRCAEKLIICNKYDFILTRNPSSEIAGLYLSKKYNIRWIANWNDPYPEKRMPEPYGGGKDAKLSCFEQKLLDNVSTGAILHTFSSERQRDYMLQYMRGVNLDRAIYIPHVCLSGIFERLPEVRENKLSIVHSGNVASPRDPIPFLMGVKKFSKGNPKAKLIVRFVGRQTDDFQQHISDMGLENWVEVISPMPYLDNLSFVASQDIALIIEAPSDNSIYLPTKVGDYMQCGKDIFAVSPSVGTLNDLYQEGNVKYFADCCDSDMIADEIGKIYEIYLSSGCRYNSSARIIEDYSEETILDKYSKILKN